MYRHYGSARGGKLAAVMDGAQRVLEVIRVAVKVTLWLLTLPLRVWGWCIDAGIWSLHAMARTIVGLIGFALMVAPLVGIGYVLLYPWLR